MAIRATESLITVARGRTGNIRYSATQGVPQSRFVEAINAGQRLLESELRARHSMLMTAVKELPLEIKQDTVALPSDAYGLSVKKVEYREANRFDDWITLKQGHLFAQGESESDTFVLLGNSVNIGFKPKLDAFLRITYGKTLDRLEVRSGRVKSVVMAGDVVTAIELKQDKNLDSDALSEAEFICVGDKRGNVTEYNIEVVSFTPSSHTISVSHAPTSTPPTGWDFVTVGENTTTHCKLPAACEIFLIDYCIQSIKDDDVKKTTPSQIEAWQTYASSIVETLVIGERQANMAMQARDPFWFEE